MKFRTDCKVWQGYKPCVKQKQGLTENCAACSLYDPIQENILIIEAGGLGSALRTSVVMEALKSRYPNSLVQWLTNDQSVELAKNIPSVDKAFATTWENMTILAAEMYDMVVNFESNAVYLAFTSELRCARMMGFTLNNKGGLELVPN